MTMTAPQRGNDPNNDAMRPATAPSVKMAIRNRDRIRQAVLSLPDELLIELARRVEQSSAHDGYPSQSMGLGVQARAESTSVESAAAADDPSDSALKAVREVFDGLAAASAILCGSKDGIQRKAQAVLHAADGYRGRQGLGGDCEACERYVSGVGDTRAVGGQSADQLRTNLCNACYTAWLRWRGEHQTGTSGADRAEFIRWRRAEATGPAEDA